MRPLAAAAALVVALGASLLAISHLTESGGRRVGNVTMVGDSLNVGTERYLEQRLDGWTILHDDVVGRSGLQGLAALQSLGPASGPVVVISLGTNDSQTDTAGFRRLVEGVLEAVGPSRCVIWSTIWRGGSSTALNDVLRDLAGKHSNLEVADWSGLVGDRPELVGPDGVHATPEGYSERAQQVAKLAERCLPAAETAS